MSQFIIVDDSSKDITYTGAWSNTTSDITNASFWNSMHGNLTFFQNTFHFTTGPASLSYSYYGAKVFLRGSFIGDNNASSTAMYPDFKVDGQLPNSVNPAVAQNGGQWSISWDKLPPDRHMLTVGTIGVPSADQQNFLIDSIAYIPLQDDLSMNPDVYLRSPNIHAPEFNFDTGWNLNGGPIQTSQTNSTASYMFNGTSITWWGGCFQEKDLQSTNAATAIYSVDGQPPVSFQIDDTSVSGPNCNLERILFQETSLQPGSHNLTVIYQGDKDKMLLSLNSIAYSTTASSGPDYSGSVTPTSPSSPSTSSSSASSSGASSSGAPSSGASSSSSSPDKIGIILGSIIGGLAFVFLLVFVAIVLRRRNRRRQAAVLFEYNIPRLRAIPSIDLAIHDKPESIFVPTKQRSSLSKSFSIRSFGYGPQQTAQVGSDYGSPVHSPNDSMHSFVLAPNRKDPES